MRDLNFKLNVVGKHYLLRLRLIDWEAAQWMQYIGFNIVKNPIGLGYNVSLKFKTSTYGIGFDLHLCTVSEEEKALMLYGKFEEIYNFFKALKYELYSGGDSETICSSKYVKTS